MHKSHYMSQERITLPFILDDLHPVPARLEPVNRRECLRNPGAARFRFADEKAGKSGMPVNPWELRDRFLSWPLDDWQRFFEISGEWDVRVFSRVLSRDDFAEWQRLLRTALVRRDWDTLAHEFDWRKVVSLRLPLSITFEWDGKVPAARIRSQNPLRAMVATIQVEKLQGATFKDCARSDCKNAPFRVEARHKIFCSSDCAHLVAVRKSRARLAAADNSKSRLASKSRRNK
jgi:hypothetical protein